MGEVRINPFLSASRLKISGNLFDFADTSSGGMVAILGGENEKLVKFVLPDVIEADQRYRPQADKVFSLNPQAGTLVPKGTKVNIVLVAQDTATVDMFEETHEALADIKLVQVFDDFLRNDTEAFDIVDKYAHGETLTSNERALMENKFQAQGISIVAGEAKQDLDAGLKALSGALLIGARD